MEAHEKRVVIEPDHCSNCEFYITEDYEIEGVGYARTFGACRRFPPKRIDGAASGFPIVEDDWWCGEHQKKYLSDDK